MGVATITFVVIFILVSSAGLLLFYREAMVQRLSGLVTPGQKLRQRQPRQGRKQ